MRKEVPTAGDVPVPFAVTEMFDRIAPTYDLLNHLLSLGRDPSWRRRAAERLDGQEIRRVADLATGTGDLLIALLRRCPDLATAIGLDLSERMLARCREKLRRCGLEDRVELVRADASATPFSKGGVDAVTMAFGIRNAASAEAVLKEIHRILRPGGIVLILEFSLPENRFLRWCHLTYLRLVVPVIGARVSRDRNAYRYLNESIERFCRTQDLPALIRRAGFDQISVTPLTFGVASIYMGTKV